jgi:hypothetical protein
MTDRIDRGAGRGPAVAREPEADRPPSAGPASPRAHAPPRTDAPRSGWWRSATACRCSCEPPPRGRAPSSRSRRCGPGRGRCSAPGAGARVHHEAFARKRFADRRVLVAIEAHRASVRLPEDAGGLCPRRAPRAPAFPLRRLGRGWAAQHQQLRLAAALTAWARSLSSRVRWWAIRRNERTKSRSWDRAPV